MKNLKAFTLVELIVVVTILAILSTIGFVSYSGYLTGVRDTNRISSLTALSDGLELYRTKNDLPLPDDSVEVKVNNTTIARQGYVGKNVLQTIEYSKAGKDPKDDSYYSYYLTDDNKYYQLMAFLEESDQLEVNILSQTNAATNYSNRHPKVYGKRLGILTDTDNTPIQEVASIVSDGELNFTGGTSTQFISRMDDSQNLQGSGSILQGLKLIGSTGGNIYKKDNIYLNCKDILLSGKGKIDGIYTITPDGETKIDVYCDMTTKGGGWTLLFQRRESSNNLETCGTDLNNFINGSECGTPDNLGDTVSYSIGGIMKQELLDLENYFGGGSEIMFAQYLNGVEDSDDTFIVETNIDIFPNIIHPIQNIEIDKICSLGGNCDSDNVYWKYAGDYHFSNTRCNNNTAPSGYGGMYGYCLNGLIEEVADGGLGGNRDTYNQVKLWNHSNAAGAYSERVI